MKFLLSLFALALIVSLPLRGAESESMADRTLRQLVERQKELLAEAAKDSTQLDQDGFQTQMQQICSGYEALLRDSPNYAAGYAAYGYLLGKIGQRKQSIAILLKANQLDKDMPLVKNQIGNFLAEEGKPLEALPYFLAAIKLEPKEPLYHYQLGTLLHEARDDFLKSGEWTADALNHAMHEAFRQAAELAPGRIEFTYRYAESFYDLENPDWNAALKAWGTLEEQAGSDVERQTMRLQAANVLIKQGRPDHARLLLDSVTEATLQTLKQKLVAQLPAKAEK